MGGDLKRERAARNAPGFSAPSLAGNDMVSRLIAEVQQAIAELSGQAAAANAAATTTDTYDDSDLRRRIQALEHQYQALLKRVKALERKFPIFRYCKVVAEYGDYLQCAMWNPISGTAGGELLVAKPWSLRVTPYSGQDVTLPDGSLWHYEYAQYWERQVSGQGAWTNQNKTEVYAPYVINEQLVIAKTNSGVFDGSGQAAIWEDLNLAGRCWIDGPRVRYPAHESDLADVQPFETFSKAAPLNTDREFSWLGGSWLCVSHMNLYDPEALP